ncbi:hypothetical protein B0H14DRAFT_3432340 [Mycena olivaceomarginata]|nr:hypothetical protein B0H14DRAFT_3432340 [Mycena olivaceomarginata]
MAQLLAYHRDLATSVSAPLAAPSPSRLPNRIPATAPAKSPSCPLSRIPAAVHETGTSVLRCLGPRHLRGPVLMQAPPTPAPLIPGHRICTTKEAASFTKTRSQKAVEEMADTDTVQVIDYKHAVQYLSAGRHSNADETTHVLGILDLPADDNEANWVDEDTHLQGLGTMTHRSRNPLKAVIPRKCRSRVVGAKRTADEKAARGLAADLDTLHQESEERAQELAAKYRMKVKEVRRRVHASSAFKTRHKVSLYNVKISALMARLNEDCDVGCRYTMPDIKRMVKDDPSMLEGFSKEEEGSMVDNIREKRDKKHQGARANNLATSADGKRTVEHLMEEIMGLAEHLGMIGFAMFTRGHIHDTLIPRDPADIAALFELWGVSRARGKPGDTGAETQLSIQKECTGMIKTGLQTITGRTKIAMNYDNYIKAIVEGKNFGLRGWLRDVDFKRMSKRWAVLSASQKKKHLADFQEMVDEGKATQKSAKPRGKAKPKQVGEPRTSTRAGRKGIASVRSDDNDDWGSTEENKGDASEGDTTEGEEGPSRRLSAVGAWEAQRQRLLALVGRKNAAAGGEGDRRSKGAGAKSTQRKGGKRKRDIEDDGAPAAKAKS